jgi:hypothetical protein
VSLGRTTKEAVRHLFHRAGYRRRLPHLQDDRRRSFAAIYDQGAWRHGDESVPPSGHGSSIGATEGVRGALPGLLETIGTKTLLDLGCGDFTWMQTVRLPCNYIGVDIVPSVIEQNRRNFASPQREFEVLDFVVEVPPKADTVLSREVLFHLSLDDGLAGLRNALATGCTHLLLTSDRGTNRSHFSAFPAAADPAAAGSRPSNRASAGPRHPSPG